MELNFYLISIGKVPNKHSSKRTYPVLYWVANSVVLIVRKLRELNVRNSQDYGNNYMSNFLLPIKVLSLAFGNPDSSSNRANRPMGLYETKEDDKM